MRHSFGLMAFSLCFLCASQSYAKSVCENDCANGWEKVAHGIQYCHKKNSERKVYILKIDLQAKGVKPFVTPDPNGHLKGTSKFVSQYGVQVATNASFFAINNKDGERWASGFQKSNGSKYCYSSCTGSSKNTFGFDKQNHYLQGQTDAIREQMYNATSGGHIIVKNGAKVDHGNGDFSITTHPRTATGVDKSGRYFYMVVVDGRQTGRTGMSLSDLSDCMIALGAYQAINMDGGGSSTMVVSGKGIVNSPSDGHERSVASHLGFFADKTCTASAETCNNVDDDCDGKVDEDSVCDIEDETMYQAMTYNTQNTDIDGDGKADICVRGAAGVYCTFSKSKSPNKLQLAVEWSNDSGWKDVSNYATIGLADINGDGLADLCARSNAGIYCRPSTGTKFGASTKVIPMADADGYNDVKYYSTIRFADINGDGRDDVCARFKDGFKCFPSEASGWGKAIALGSMADKDGWDKQHYYSTIRMADINGDGKADVCARAAKGYLCWISKGDKFASNFVAAEWSNANGWNKPEYYSTIRMADINGDHKADICARNAEKVVCHLSEGSKFGAEIAGPALKDSSGWNGYDNYSTLRMGDFNGDGKDDLCIRANAEMKCYPSKGKSFGSALTIKDMSNDNGWNKPNQFRTIRMGDINGDGKMEVCGRNADGFQCYYYNGSTFDHKAGPNMANASGWGNVIYYPTIRLGGPVAKPCSLQKETCDKIDNNCNGKIDEGNVCCTPSEEICDGKDNNCDGKIDEGDVCKQEPECTPSKEICDGKDNNCDGQIDEDNVCCEPSEEICDGIDNDCNGEVDDNNVCCEPSEEVCDEKDNDCDGQVDEDNVCQPECVPTEEVCDGVDNNCDGNVDENDACNIDTECTPTEESCDGIDNDCDNEIDEDNVCGSEESCTPSDEICDGIDNDCDNEIDEDNVCGSEESCTPSDEICDGIDNDCDNEIDEDCENTGDNRHSADSDCSTQSQNAAPHSGFASLTMLLLGGLAIMRRKRTPKQSK